MATFNSNNPFPAGIRLYTVGADADLDDNGSLNSTEAAGFPSIGGNAEWATAAYRVLRDVASIRVVRRTSLFGQNEWHEISGNPTATPQINDVVVTDTSSQHPRQVRHFGPLDRNHLNMKDGATLQTVLERLRADFPVN